MPFTSAFCISITFSWPVIVSTICTFFILCFLLLGKKIHIFKPTAIALISIFLIHISVSFFYNNILKTHSSFILSKSLNHLFAYITTFINFFVSVLLILYLNRNPSFFLKIFNLLTWILLFSCIFAIIEFTLKNVYSIDFDSYIPHPAFERMSAVALGDVFKSIRARGLSEEPGHFAFMINLFLPLAVYYLFFSNKCNFLLHIKILFILIYTIALILTFSTAAFFTLPVGLLISFAFFYKNLTKYLPQIITFSIVIIVGAIILDIYFPILTQLAFDIDQKTSNSASMDDRTMRFLLFQTYFNKAPILNKIIGYGPSGYLHVGLQPESESFLVLYQTFIFESGILGICIFSTFLFNILIYLRKIIFPLNFFLFFSFVLGILHYFFISNYWYPWYWFICACIIYISTFDEYRSSSYKA